MTEEKCTKILTVVAVFVISIMWNVQAHASIGRVFSGYCVNERSWTCEYPVNVVRETVRSPVLRKYNHPGGRKDLIPEIAAKVGALVPTLAAKVGEIISQCGSKLISGFRPHAHVAGTNHASLHSTYPSRAADLRGNPGCMYPLLVNWPGGYSVDYVHVKHLHLSYSPPGSGYLAGREWHARFTHHGGSHHRYAHVRAHRQNRG